MTFAAKLSRLLRVARVAPVAKAAQISQNTLYVLAAGKHQPTLSKAAAIARALGVDLGWLVDDSKGWPPVRVTPSTDLAPEATHAA